jgi:phosphomethylpyrimidine synthase
VRRGLVGVRSPWIESRGDTESYIGRTPYALDDGLKNGESDALAALRLQAAGLQRTPRRAKAGGNVSQMHYARQGSITPEMEYVPSARTKSRPGWSNTWATPSVKRAWSATALAPAFLR